MIFTCFCGTIFTALMSTMKKSAANSGTSDVMSIMSV